MFVTTRENRSIAASLAIVLIALTLIFFSGGKSAYASGWYSNGAGWNWRFVGSGVEYSSLFGDFVVHNGPFASEHGRYGGGGGVLGYPVANQVNEAGGTWWYQRFERGTIYVSPHGTFAVLNSYNWYDFTIDDEHRIEQGGGSGALGYPISEQHEDAPGYAYQIFERGVIYMRPTNSGEIAESVTGRIDQIHREHGGGTGWLGYPTSEAMGSTQYFEHGMIVGECVSSSYSCY